MTNRLGLFVALPGVTSVGAAVPSFLGGLIFAILVKKPLLNAVIPLELIRFKASFSERLLLTAPLTLGVALIAFLFLYKVVEDVGPLMLLSGALLTFTTWLGKTMAFGWAADLSMRSGRFVVEDGNRLVWQPDTSSMATDILSGNVWTKWMGILISYFKLYGPELFFLSIGSGIILGWYWSWQLRKEY